MSRLARSLVNGLNIQAAKELFASNYYLAASFWCAGRNLPGFAKYLLNESNEERTHGLQMYDYLMKRDTHPLINEIPQPKKEWASCTTLFQDIVNLEEEFTVEINNLVTLGVEEKDQATVNFLNPFVNAQIDAIASQKQLMAKVMSYEQIPGFLQQLDDLLGSQSVVS